MKLDGGILTYATMSSFKDFKIERYNTNNSPKGRKVKYLGENGYDFDTQYTDQFFKKGEILIVSEIYVGRSSSQVEFQGYEGKKFNTVMFEDVEV